MKLIKILTDLFGKIGSPKKYKDIVSSYTDYEYLQKNTFCSLESKNKLFSSGQVRCVDYYFKKVPLNKKILDIACGDGTGLKHFKQLGFKNVVGVEFNNKKSVLASKYGYPVYEEDMHTTPSIQNEKFDYIYCSHTLEHAYNPKLVLTNFKKLLNKNGKLIIILPYPDQHTFNIKAHGAKFELGTNISDNGQTVVRYFNKLGYKLVEKKFDTFREPEIWLTFSLS